MVAAEPRRFGLAAHLVWGVLLASASLALILFGYVGPRAQATLAAHGEQLRHRDATALHALASAQTTATARVLADVIEQGAQARQNELADLPLELLAEPANMRDRILRVDQQRSARMRSNVAILAAEMQARAEADITRELAALAHHREQSIANTSAQLARTHLWLVASALGLVLAVLWLGLHYLVVKPTRALQRAAAGLAAGDLAAPLPPPKAGEIGELVRDFARMRDELAQSRRRLEQQQDVLREEVRKQTAHLEQALVDLQATHQQLAASERLASLGTLAGGIAHEFQNVLGGMRGCTEELLADEAQPDRAETMRVVLRAAERGTQIVQQLLRFARHSVEARTDLDPAQLLHDALVLCEPGARRQQVTVVRELAAGLRVHADPTALHQVLVNLLINALQAMPSGGTLTVSGQARQSEVELRIADTGSGIAPEHLPHIFEPFFTTKTNDSERPGTGLGLSVSHGIIASHGGRIDVASQVGFGTIFAVRLPMTRPTP